MMRNLNPIELQQILDDDNSIALLDVREPWEFEIVYIKGSIHIPMGELTQRLDELNSEKTTAVICHHGIRSRMVCTFLKQNDFQDLINLRGGIDAWAKEVDLNMPLYT